MYNTYAMHGLQNVRSCPTINCYALTHWKDNSNLLQYLQYRSINNYTFLKAHVRTHMYILSDTLCILLLHTGMSCDDDNDGICTLYIMCLRATWIDLDGLLE